MQGFSHRYPHDFDAYHACRNTSTMGRYANGSVVCNASRPTVASECCSCPSTRGSFPGIKCMQGENAPGLLPYVSGSIGVWTLVFDVLSIKLIFES